jgi:hypothetical protein
VLAQLLRREIPTADLKKADYQCADERRPAEVSRRA